MPYKSKVDLPEGVKSSLPPDAQEIYRKAFNSAWQHYDEPHERREDDSQEETAHKVAWSAVKRKYFKDEARGWVSRNGEISG